MKNTIEQRFFAKVDKTDDCWNWVGYIGKDGYGAFHSEVGRKAHRYAVTLDGRNPTNLYVLHHCDNPRCVRPDHLFLGTQLDNMRDRSEKGRAPQSQPKHRRLTEDAIRDVKTSMLSSYEMASKYNVSPGTVQRIRNNKIYREIA